MIPIIDVNQRIEFVSTQDKTDPKTIFVLKPLTGSETMELVQHSTDLKSFLDADYVNALLKKSIVEIKNGSKDKTKEEIIDALPADVIMEIIGKIGQINYLKKEGEN